MLRNAQSTQMSQTPVRRALDYGPSPARGSAKRKRASATPGSPDKRARVADSPTKAPATLTPAKPKAAPRRRSPEVWSPPEKELEQYRSMLANGDLFFGQLAPHTWVAEGYNISQQRRPRTRTGWTHVSATHDGDMELVYDCLDCKQFKSLRRCVHTLLLQEDAQEYLMFSETFDPLGVVFEHKAVEDEGENGDGAQQTRTTYADLTAATEHAKQRSVSWDKAGLPPWARTGPEDDEGVGKYEYKRPLPMLLALSGEGRCRCGTHGSLSMAVEEISCMVYDHTHAFPARIQVRRCGRCPPKSRMASGPDLGSLGLFNHNNQTVVTHALLNKYDSMLGAGEATYNGFCAIMEREYQTYGSAVPFMNADWFRNAWFAFTHLQECF
ncbi:hypothetical protein AURDEDRAFT_174524 [Auricularia subglabra TFB-10046 SS5]|uniref:HMG domain-containing protein n=1 Tax=Auricularia subglabra (strain TFB-10046 / SS5) TaxID=717982 RepID=J0D9D7_AURST|nr:hypothetical protein AURDEDRAFT_174524 [Auricularia subglabra TFB-10046 SS5]